MSKTYIIDALRLHLKALNMTYKALAHAIGLSKPCIKRLFTGGEAVPDLSYALALRTSLANFQDNPTQSMGTPIHGFARGPAINDEFFRSVA